MRYAIWIIVFLSLSSGCSVRGFQNIPDGPTSPSQLRAAAAVARAEATALDAIAAEEQGQIDRAVAFIRETVEEVVPGGAGGDLLAAAVGLGAGFVIPTPGQRRREKVAAAEAKASGLPPAS